MDLLFAFFILAALCVGVYVLLSKDLPAILVMAVVLVMAFVLGGLLGTLLNWPDAPTVVAVAVAGGFLWRELRAIREELQAQNFRTPDGIPVQEPDSDPPGGAE